ncbi:hypothetical protein Ddye_001512 [Dipteronia dyeriana]|uniref:PGG domain-containing protein n=1 Tax=Dipteronia dyeriana TaxID=168575 RepID=A0AAE0CU23_9ROSI|nr:hypothetical protein Ddye_001512 [Dipteronia dyeriana]
MRNDANAAQNERYEVEVVIPPRPLLGGEASNRKRHLKLYGAAVKGDWGAAKSIFEKYPEDIQARISKAGDTALHIAAAANRPPFVKELVNSKHMNVDYLATKNNEENTAFCLAAASGNIELVDLMLKKNEELARTRGKKNMLPIQMAALLGQEKMVQHLYHKAGKGKDYLVNQDDLIELLVTLINNYLYDAALMLLKDHPELATLRAGNEETALHALARKPLTSSDLANPNDQQGILKSFFNLFSGTNMVHNKRMHPKALELVEILWEKVIIMFDDYQISQLIASPWRLIFVAAEHGNVQLLSILIDKYPDLIFKVDEVGYSIFHIAVLNRHERIFNLIYETGSIKDLIVVTEDKEENNILHLAAKLPPPNRLNIVSGAALQLQRELLWFKEVKKVVQPLYAEAKNKKEKTPRALFSEQHVELMGKGEEWMKTTAESCMIVAALIATVVFAAAFTVPGGVKEDTGSPNFLKKLSFIIFSISDPISLVCSSCSILTFLSILTSRYAEEDFLWSLPTKLVLGISTLFVSIATMMVVFCVSLFILFNEGMQELAILATALACIPVFLFLWQQYRLLVDIVRSTYVSNSLFHHKKQTHILLGKTNPEDQGSY